MCTSTTANVVDFGAAGDGVTDDTEAWRNAMLSAGGGEVFIPRGRYVLRDCEIPRIFGCDLAPEEGAEVLVPRGATYGGLYFRGDLNFSPPVTATAVEVVTGYHAQSVTKITGAFTGYAAGDICALSCDALQTVGVADVEMFSVLGVATDSTFIYANRLFVNRYDASATKVMVRRATAQPSIRIRKGLTMRPDGDPSVGGAKSSMVRLLCPISADVSVHFENLWNIGLWMTLAWRGQFDITWNGVHVNYAIAAYGYIVNLQGGGYCPEFKLSGSKSGHAITVGARTGAYSDAHWFYHGIPFGHVVRDSCVNDARRAAYDEHYGYHGVYINCVTTNSRMDDLESSNQTDAFAISGLNTTIINPVGEGVKSILMTNSKNYGKTNTISIINPAMRSRGTTGVSGLLHYGAHVPDLMTVRVVGGIVDVDTVGVIDNYKGRTVVSGTTFLNCSRLFNLSSANSDLTLLNCVYAPSAASLSYAGTIGLSSQTLTVDGLHVSTPNEITHVAQVVQAGATVRMGRVTCPTALSRFTGQAPTVVDIVTATS